MRDPAHRIVLAILLVAFALRLGFALAVPARPLYWDEPIYDSSAKLFARAWSSQSAAAAGAALREALQASQQKGEAYAATVGLLYAVVGEQPRAVFVVQAVLDTVMCYLLFGLARALGGVRAGMIALALAALYEPFIFSAARLQTEAVASLLYVAGLWAVCVPERRRAVGAFVAGISIAASMLAKPALEFILPVLLPGVLVRNSDRAWRDRLVLVLIFTAGFLAVIGPRLALTKIALGESAWASTLDPSVDMYGGAVLDNVGWKTDRVAFASPPRDELRAVLGSDPARQPQMEDYRAATIRTWVVHPFESAAVTLHKLYEAWLHPYNDSRWTLLTGASGQALFHQVVLLLALLGMPLALHRWRVAVPLIAATLYLWLSYLVVKIEVRYAVTAMPLMICFAGVALAGGGTGWQLGWRAGERRRLIVPATTAAASLIAAWALSIERLLQWLPLAPDAAHGVRVAVLLAAVVSLTWLAAELVRHRWRRATALTLLAPSAAVAALVILVGRPLAQTWREWQCTLTPQHGIASQEFVLPTGIGRPSSAVLKLDLLPQRAGTGDVVVRVDDEEIKRYRGGLSRGDADLPSANYYEQLFAARRRDGQPERAWYTIAISPERLVPGARIAVDVALEGAGEPSGSVALFGDYPPDRSTYAGPSLLSPAINADTSLYKYLAEGDFRMRRRVSLSGSSHSRFDDGRGWSERDLAFDSGRQLGRYRIFLVLEYPRGIAIL